MAVALPLTNIDVVKVRRAGLFSKQTCDALPNRGQVQSNPCGLLDSKSTCRSIGLAYIQTVLQVVDRTRWCHLSPVTASVLARTDLATVFSLVFCLFSSHSTVFSSASHFAPSDTRRLGSIISLTVSPLR